VKWKVGLGVRREDLVNEFDEEIAEFVAQGVAKAGKEVGGDRSVVGIHHNRIWFSV